MMQTHPAAALALAEKPEHVFREVSLAEVQAPAVVQATENDGFILKPRDIDQVAKLMYYANEQAQPLTMRELDTVYLNQPVQLSMERFDQVIDHQVEDLVITVESGITMGQLQQELGRQHQAFPLNYPPKTRLIDVLGEDRPSLETGFMGYPRDYVLGLDVISPQGKRIQTGGKVVKNVTGYDMNKWYVGSHHALGVITAVTLKCIAAPDAHRDWCITYDSYETAYEALLILQSAGFPIAYAEIAHEIRVQPEKVGEFVDWCLFFGVRGPQSWMPELVPHICALLGLDPNTSVLHTQTTRSYLTHLNTWQPRDLVLEVALPASMIQAFLVQVEADLPESEWPWVQVRPMAGLIYLVWPFGDGVPSVQALRILCGQWLDALTAPEGYPRGHLHWVQFPRGYVALAQYCNLPRDPVARRLTRELKSLADPFGVMVSARLPVGPHFEGLLEIEEAESVKLPLKPSEVGEG